jgi:hypothetical protein
MLRPTESPVIFLQQLGRGLRTAEGKERLSIIDFIGNHRSFLLKPRTLLSMATEAFVSTARLLDAVRSGDFGLPPGCEVSYDLEVVALLEELGRPSQGSAVVTYCKDYAEEHGYRPSAVQAWRAGFNPTAARATGWFGMLGDIGLLDGDEQRAARAHGELLRQIQSASITKSYKLVTLQAVLELGGLGTGVRLADLAISARRLMRGDPRLADDVRDHLNDSEEEWAAYWRKWPVAAWVGELRGSEESDLFRVEDDKFVPTFRITDDIADTMGSMIAELVDYRLVRYLDGRQRPGEWRLRVGQTNGRPLIWLGRERNTGIPEGEVELLVNGRPLVANFVKIALNAVRESGGSNVLPGVLSEWFGPGAGAPGTSHQVLLRWAGETFQLEPVTTEA